MFDELGPWLSRDKARDLLKRLDNVAPDQALPAEYELGLTWAVSRIASLQIDKPMGGRTPDIYSSDLLPNRPLVADVAAVDDVSLSGIATMRRARNIINLTCDEIRKQCSKHLQYTFGDESGYARSSNGRTRYYRRRLVSRDFQMDERFRKALKTWLATVRPVRRLVWRTADIGVSIGWKDFAHPFANIFCTMPSLAHDLRDNSLYRVLKVKSRQLRDVPADFSRAIFLGNAGCSLLNDIQPMGSGLNTFSGKQIIQRYLADDNSIDLVVVFSVERLNQYSMDRFNNPRVWRRYIFHQGEVMPADDLARLNLLTKRIPAPYLSGYEAHSWHEQGMCSPDARGHYLGSKMSFGRGRMTLRISARAVQELMAGTLSPEMFRDSLFGQDNPVHQQLAAGCTISDVRFEPKGVDHDDDYLVFEFGPDFAATPLRLPIKLRNDPIPKPD